MNRSTMTPPKGVKKLRPATTALPALSANDMRRLAEKADGWRKLSPILARKADGTLDVIIEEERTNETPLLRFDTRDRNKGLNRTVKISIQVESGPQTNKYEDVFELSTSDVQAPDAVFITQSSVSKFLFPYYLRFKEPAAIEKMAVDCFDDNSVVGVIHLPGSSYKADKVVTVSFDAKKGVTLTELPI